MANELKSLKYKRGVVKGNVTRLKTYFDVIKGSTVTDEVLEQLTSRLNDAESYLCEFNNIQESIDILLLSENPPEGKTADQFEGDILSKSCIDRDQFEKSFRDIISQIKIFLQKHKSCDDSSSISSLRQNNVVSNVRFPQINLPTFSGAYEDWMEFHDIFHSLIHNNNDLDDVQKFYYFKSCLKGDAANVLKSLEVSGSNYSVAWSLLNDRFENKRLITNNHIKNILDFNAITKESPVALRTLSDNLNKHLRCLKGLGHPVESWDTLIIQIILTKLDHVSRKEWEQVDIQGDYPTIKEFTTFLKKRCDLLEAMQANSVSKNDSYDSKRIIFQKKKHDLNHTNSYYSSIDSVCVFCKKSHSIYNCPDFLKLSPKSRITEVKKLNLCFNCLRKNHLLKDCTAVSCRKCSKHHHTLLHFETQYQNEFNERPKVSESLPKLSSGTSEENTATNTVTYHSLNSRNPNQILLATIIVLAKNNRNEMIPCRALLDCGSQSNFVTQNLCDRLNLRREPCNSVVSGIAENLANIRFRVNLEIHSRHNGYKTNLSCLILKQITEKLPSFSFDPSTLDIPPHIQLADPTFSVPGDIDILIGASIFWQILCAGQLTLGQGKPILTKTCFGWILSGNYLFNSNPMPSRVSNNLSYHCIEKSIERDMSRFWELEEVEGIKRESKEESLVEEWFIKNVERSNSGRFIVKIPFKQNVCDLGESREIALKRLHGLERKLSKNPELKQQYISFLSEYEKLGHMTRIKEYPIPTKSCYLPHHCVEKQSSTTTKVRVVFDASCKTSSGLSLNEVQMVGPVIQKDLFTLILNFRTFKYVLTADCEKMYRQVLLAQPDRDYHRILWRPDPSKEVECFVLNTVTYGTASASYLATRVLKEIGIQHEKEYPLASYIIQNNFYMDDLATGAETVEELRKIKDDVSFILKQAGFSLRKFLSNEPSLIPSGGDVNHHFDKINVQSTLGIVWNPNLDILKYKTLEFSKNTPVTKRTILSLASQIFDPLGLLSPIIIIAKLIMQRLWQLKLSWDESVPLDLQTAWNHFRDELNFINNFEIPRHVIISSKYCIQLHGFADASQKAYGACIYLRSTDLSGNITVNLLCSKSKVAPIKSIITLPRLELPACLLLANLGNKVKSSLNINISECYYYSDSTIALAWIKSEPARWKVFVGNRVAQIQQLTKSREWHHIKSEQNPADMVSRGVEPKLLYNFSLCWNGPPWLGSGVSEWPVDNIELSKVDIPEARTQTIVLVAAVDEFNPFQRFSSFQKMCRVFAYCFRFISNLRPKPNNNIRASGNLSVEELRLSSQYLIRLAQRHTFSPEINALSSNKALPSGSKLLNLNPFIDQNNFMRVGGRLINSNLDPDMIHPIILPNHHDISRLIGTDEHRKLMHCGPQQLLFALREKYWPLSGRSLVRSVVHNCVFCSRANPKPLTQIMGVLPKERLSGSYPFQTTGVDYAGPFQLRDRVTRNFKITKAYVAIFICFLTKAIHIELVSDLTSDCFIAALRRFIARRGKPYSIHSDNGTNFVGTKNQLENLSKFLKDNLKQKHIFDFAANEGIKWCFIPPRAPHFGGLWESGVRSIKTHLIKVVRTSVLFLTVLTQIEAILNSRPLYPMSPDPLDLNPITPSHFLIGRSLTSLLDQPLQCMPDTHLDIYQKIQKLIQSFWDQWRRGYLSELQVRTRWKVRSPSIQVGDMVVVKEDNLHPCHWKLGRILDVYNGPDNIPRVVKIFCSSGKIKRPITKICPLPVEPVNSS